MPLKMVGPTIASGVEEPDDIARPRKPSRDVRSLVPIAVETSQREVVCDCFAAMLAGNDMVDVEWQRVSRGG